MNPNIPTKNPGDQFTSAEVNSIVSAFPTKADLVNGTINPTQIPLYLRTYNKPSDISNTVMPIDNMLFAYDATNHVGWLQANRMRFDTDGTNGSFTFNIGNKQLYFGGSNFSISGDFGDTNGYGFYLNTMAYFNFNGNTSNNILPQVQFNNVDQFGIYGVSSSSSTFTISRYSSFNIDSWLQKNSTMINLGGQSGVGITMQGYDSGFNSSTIVIKNNVTITSNVPMIVTSGITISSGDLEVAGTAKGIILKDTADGTRHRVVLTNGILTVSAAL